MTAQSFRHTARFARSFSAKTKRDLLSKGVAIVGAQAIPATPDDLYFTGTGYQLTTKDGRGFMRTFNQVCAMASSSWTVADL